MTDIGIMPIGTATSTETTTLITPVVTSDPTSTVERTSRTGTGIICGVGCSLTILGATVSGIGIALGADNDNIFPILLQIGGGALGVIGSCFWCAEGFLKAAEVAAARSNS